MRWLPLCLCALLACEGDRAGAAGVAGAAGQGGEPACQPEPGAVCVDRVKGAVLDEQRQPRQGAVVSVCGRACFVGQTGPQGSFSVRVERPARPDEFALLVHGRRSHATVYLRLPALAAEIALAEPIVTPAFAWLGAPLPQGEAATISAGPLALDIEAGTAIELDIDDSFEGDEGRRLRAVAISLPPAFAPGAAVALALAPFGARLSKPAAVRLAAPPSLAEGQAVELLVLDDRLLADEGNLAGLPRRVATGHVAQGQIRSDAGQGLDQLTWLVARALP